MIRARWRGPSDGDDSTSNNNSTRVFDVLACCPPGPPDELNRHSSSSGAITQVRVMRRRSGTPGSYERVSGLYAMRWGWSASVPSRLWRSTS